MPASPVQRKRPTMSPDFLYTPPGRYRAGSLKQVWLAHWQAAINTPRRVAQAIHLLPTHRAAVATPTPRRTA